MKIIKNACLGLFALVLFVVVVLLLVSFVCWVNPIELATRIVNWTIVRFVIAILIFPLLLGSTKVDAQYD